MSLEQLIADNTAALNANTEAQRENTARVMELIAASAEARAVIDRMEPGGSKPATRSRKAKDEAPAAAATTETPAAETPAAAAATETKPGARTRNIDLSPDAVREQFATWLSGDANAEEQGRRAGIAGAIVQHFGAANLRSFADDEQRYYALFYLERAKAGLKIDFNQEYDFDGDPLFDAAPAASATENLLG